MGSLLLGKWIWDVKICLIIPNGILMCLISNGEKGGWSGERVLILLADCLICDVIPLAVQYIMRKEYFDDFGPPKRQGEEVKPKNMKNIYIQKLSKYFGLSRENLAEVEEADNEPESAFPQTLKREIKSSININGKEGKELNDKLEKNRESARKARKRKKLYVKLLEKQVEKYKDIAQEGKELEKDVQRFMSELRNHINKKKDHSSLKSVIMNNIMNVVSFSNQFSDADVNALIHNYQAKYGPSSVDRFQSIDSSLQQIKDMFLPTHITNIFNSDNDKLIKQIQKNNNGYKIDLKQISSVKESIDKECNKLNHSLNVFKQTIDMTKQQLKEINKTIDDMKQLHGGSETCRFLMMVEDETLKPGNIKEFKEFLDQLVRYGVIQNFDSVKQNDEERYQEIFKEDVKKNILIKGKVSESLMRRINIYLDREII